jgi:hypothetical protein
LDTVKFAYGKAIKVRLPNYIIWTIQKMMLCNLLHLPLLAGSMSVYFEKESALGRTDFKQLQE